MNIFQDIIRNEEEMWIKKNPKSQVQYKKACNVLPSGNSRSVLYYHPFPAYMKKGLGTQIWDIDENEYIDNFFNATVLVCGHNHPDIVKAVREQLNYGTVFGGPTENEIKLSEILVDQWPSAEMVKFCNSGSEAVLQACRVARSYTGKDKIAKFEGSYHGCWDAVDISVYPSRDKMGPPDLPNSVRENEGIPDNVLKNTIIMPYNDIESIKKIIVNNADDLAAILIEPAAAHCNILPKEGFLEEIRELTEKYGIVLIFDEIICQSVSSGGAQKKYGVTPDITTLGKLIGGGFPIGAYVGKEDIMEPVLKLSTNKKPRLTFSGTFNAFPITMAAGIATHGLLDENAYDHMENQSLKIKSGLKKILVNNEIIAQITGIGRFYDILWMKEVPINFRSFKSAANAMTPYLQLAMLNRGIYKIGTLCSVTSDADVKKTLDVFDECISLLKPVLKEMAPFLIT